MPLNSLDITEMIKEENRNDLSDFSNTGNVNTPQIIKKVYHHDTFDQDEKEKTDLISSKIKLAEPSQKVKFQSGRTVLEVEEI